MAIGLLYCVFSAGFNFGNGDFWVMGSILIHPDLVANITKQLPEDVKKLLQHIGPGICVAGGFCRDAFFGECPKEVDIFGTKDVDIFGASEETLREAIDWFGWNCKEYDNGVMMANSRTFKARYDQEVQPVQLIESFDWSVCQCAVYTVQKMSAVAMGGYGICTKAFGEDIQAGKLHYTAPERDEDPGASVLRMMKLTRRGFKPTEDSIARCIGRFASLGLHRAAEDHGRDEDAQQG
jgi:hypothetical protein